MVEERAVKAHEALWRTIYAEAEPDDELDGLAIGRVILNRVAYPNWPDSVTAVCFQPYQFSCWNDNAPRKQHNLEVEPDSSPWASHCHSLAKRLLEGTAEADPTRKATHYYATYAPTPKWARGKKPTLETDAGDYVHRFYNDIDTPPPKNAKEALDQQRSLSESRTARGAVGAGAAGGGIGIDGATEVIDTIERGSSIMSEGGWVKLALGLVIVAFAAYIFYARMNDRDEGRN